MKHTKNPFSALTKGEWALYLVSLGGVLASFLLAQFAFGGSDPVSTLASFVGVTALIFVAKGMPLGQVLTIVFALFYGIASLSQRYWGEMITYLGMSAPMALCALVAWVKNPYKDSGEVKVKRLRTRHFLLLTLTTIAVTVAFYFILRALDTASLLVSTLSVTTSFFASALTFLRSPYYALAYAANDLVLIVLWGISSLSDPSYLPMLICFVLFFANDLYGFCNWRRMERRQKG